MLNPIDLKINERLKNHAFAVEYVAAQSEANAQIQADKDKRIEELEAALQIGVSDMINRLYSAGLAEQSPTTGRIMFTPEGESIVRARTRRPAVG